MKGRIKNEATYPPVERFRFIGMCEKTNTPREYTAMSIAQQKETKAIMNETNEMRCSQHLANLQAVCCIGGYS